MLSKGRGQKEILRIHPITLLKEFGSRTQPILKAFDFWKCKNY